ncbi:hypothetical protein B0H13DRAFT_1905685 [Mycena leptocephala]|nr:hypothetical protein B0H13DRAFT_1905685 [Mycena leptocephala]
MKNSKPKTPKELESIQAVCTPSPEGHNEGAEGGKTGAGAGLFGGDPGRAQDGFAFKVKIDTLLWRSTCTKTLSAFSGTIEWLCPGARGPKSAELSQLLQPGWENKREKNNAEDKEDKLKERRPAEQGLTIQQNKDLATKIGKLKGPRLKVIRIIHEGVPDIKDASKTPNIAQTAAVPHNFKNHPNCFDDPDSRTLDPLPDKATHQRSPVHWRKNSRTQTAPRPGFRRGRARHACAAARR